MLNFISKLAESSATTGAGAGKGNIWVYVVLIGLVVLMLVLPMITQKKRNKEYTQMLSSLEVGDTVKTIGGVIGRVTKINEKNGQKSFILETGAKGSKTTMEFDIAAVGYILNEKAPKVEEKKTEKKEEVAPVVEEKVEEPKVEAPEVKEEVETKKIEEKKPAKKPAAKKTTTKKTTSNKASK